MGQNLEKSVRRKCVRKGKASVLKLRKRMRKSVRKGRKSVRKGRKSARKWLFFHIPGRGGKESGRGGKVSGRKG